MSQEKQPALNGQNTIDPKTQNTTNMLVYADINDHLKALNLSKEIFKGFTVMEAEKHKGRDNYYFYVSHSDKSIVEELSSKLGSVHIVNCFEPLSKKIKSRGNKPVYDAKSSSFIIVSRHDIERLDTIVRYTNADFSANPVGRSKF
jgi:hypothetical protein